MNFLSESLTTKIKEQVKDQLPQILPKEVSNFAPPMIEALIKESRDKVTLEKVSSQPHSTYEAASTLTEFELKKILIDKMEKSESYLAAPEHRYCYNSLKKSYDLDKDFFFSYDVYSLKRSRKDKDKDENPSAGSDRGLKKRKLSKYVEPTTSLKKKESMSGSSKGTKSQPKSSKKSIQTEEPVNETSSRRDWFKKPTPPKEPTDPDWYVGKTTQEGPTQNWLMTLAASTFTDKSVPFEYFINNDLKYLQGGVSTMTYTTSTTKSKVAQYDLPGIEDMVLNIWSPIKVAYDKYALWGISHWREHRKSFYAYARGIQSRGDVYSTKRILAVTHVKEGDFPRLQINDIEDMLILVKRVEDLQLGVESYQKKINVTKPDTTRPDLRKRHPYTPCKDPQGFIYVDDYKRNRLMRSDELYKFSDGTLTRLLSSLEDITKNIDMEYLRKRR
ncbi:hypothetical protein Tco_0180512 [Tanacetum coccineum]